MAIGAYEQTILDMTAAYAGMANRGVFFSPSPFEEIRGPKNELLWSWRLSNNRGKRAIDSDVADTLNWMLQQVVTGGTGIAAKLDDRQVAGKTGTSENTRDLWFIGSIPQLTTGVWFGYDDDRATKSTSGEAAWAWKQFMLQITDEIPVRNFPDKPKLKRKVRLAVDPKTIAKPPKTKPEQEKGNGNGEPDGAQPKLQTDLPEFTPLTPPPRRTPYLWRNRTPGRSVDRQGRRWTRD